MKKLLILAIALLFSSISSAEQCEQYITLTNAMHPHPELYLRFQAGKTHPYPIFNLYEGETHTVDMMERCSMAQRTHLCTFGFHVMNRNGNNIILSVALEFRVDDKGRICQQTD